MQIIKKYTDIILSHKTVEREQKVKLTYGNIEGPCYDQTYPTKIFDTEEEAIKYAYEFDDYSRWIILPTIEFEH